MKTVDARALPCPQPVIRTKEALDEINQGETITVLIDSEVSLENIKRFLSAQGHKLLEAKKKGEVYELTIEKGTSPGVSYEITCPVSVEEKPKELFLIIATDTIGKDEELGKILMKGFLETLLVSNELPQRMFFMNTGVKLTTEVDYAVEILKKLEEKGVEIFSCGTCLKYYQLEDKLRVGKRGGTDLYLSGMIDFKKVVFIG